MKLTNISEFFKNYSEFFKHNNILMENDSEKLLDLFRKINIYLNLFVIILGLIGNSLTTYIYANKKRCINSSHVYLLYSAINDSLFLIVHLFEDTLKTYLDVYSIEKDHFLQVFNLVDMNNIQCVLINYLRNILRFMSAYIVVVFTLQRFSIVYQPLTAKFKDTKSAWLIILNISIISILVNIWVPFIFKLNDDQNCDVNEKYSKEYFYINLSYILVVLLVPMILVLIFNSLILIYLKKNDKERIKLQQIQNNKKTIRKKIPRSPGSQNLQSTFLNNSTRFSKTSSFNSHNVDELIFKKAQKSHMARSSSNQTTIQLCLVSLSFFVLFLPYLIGWFIYYYFNFVSIHFNAIYKNRLFSWLQIAEIFYIFYYGIKFYILYLTSSEFRNTIFAKAGKF
jgi:hypothetical protein